MLVIFLHTSFDIITFAQDYCSTIKNIAMRRTLDDLSDEEYEDYEKHPEDYEDVTDATNEDVMDMMGELDDD